MANRRLCSKFRFSVEGETEKWYLEWLQKAVNTAPRSRAVVSIDAKVQKDPVKWAKAASTLERSAVVWHVFDFEGERAGEQDAFKCTLGRMKQATGLGRGISYKNAYSNLAFELWMVLHKGDCPALVDRTKYLGHINRLYGEHFEGLREFKVEASFKRVLSKLSLDDVVAAVGRAERLARSNQGSGVRRAEHCGYSYVLDNPATDLWIPVREILRASGVM